MHEVVTWPAVSQAYNTESPPVMRDVLPTVLRASELADNTSML